MRQLAGHSGLVWAIRHRADTRIGIGVVMESLLETAEGTALLRAQLPQLGQLSKHADARIRADACHYLALMGDPAARDWLQAALNDPPRKCGKSPRRTGELWLKPQRLGMGHG
ncbi:MAG: HEAT repeat domain-containing protein [Thiolinea sp.]